MSHNDVTALLGSEESDTSIVGKMCCRCCTEYKKSWFYGCAAFWLLFALVLGLVWPTAITSYIHSQLVIEEGTLNYKNWKETPIPMYLEITLFNLENPDEVKSGEKPILTERGPFVFLEKHTRVNVAWNSNNTVTYNQIRNWNFVQEKSNGSLDDEVTFLNVISATTAYTVRDKGYLYKKVVDILMNEEGGTFHVTKKIREVLFDGYDDKLLTFLKKLHMPGIKIPFDKFGWFVDRNGSSTYDGRFTMHTGKDSVKEIGLITEWNGSPTTGVYKDNCSLVRGTSGELWPAEMEAKAPKTVFITDVCRALDLTDFEDAEVEGIHGTKYTATERIFDNGMEYPEMSCLCTEPKCPDLLPGVVSVSECRFGAPVFASFPHFYLANEKYREDVVGMNPDPAKHGLTMTLETSTGIPLEVNARMQINMQLNKYNEISLYKDVNPVMVPMFWFRQYATLDDEFASQAKLVLLLPYIGVYVAYGLAGLGVLLLIPAIYFTLK